MPTPLFSANHQGGNRVTSSFLAVLERIEIQLGKYLLDALANESTTEMVRFTTQVAAGRRQDTVPDAEISGHFTWYFHIKTEPAALQRQQVLAHLARFETGGPNQRLYVITPDPLQPSLIDELEDQRLIWANFRSFYDILEHLLTESGLIVSERTAFLLRELQALLVEDGLIDHHDVAVVAARIAYPEYLQHHAYVCQSGRTFRAGIEYLGFYADQEVKAEVPRIVYREDHVLLTREEAARRGSSSVSRERQVGRLIGQLLDEGARETGNSYQVFLLSGPDAGATIRLDAGVPNDLTGAGGRSIAFTQGQRYVASGELRKARTTSELTGTA